MEGWPLAKAILATPSFPTIIDGCKFWLMSVGEVRLASADQTPPFSVLYQSCLITGLVPAAVLLSLVQTSQRVPSLPTAADGRVSFMLVGGLVAILYGDSLPLVKVR